jgi:alpha-1,3/alpha-1,6-mannosyltransferase
VPDTLKIAFLHPDLGLGGAERLVVDAAVELQAAGHRVTLFTTHHDRARAFPETTDGTLDVQVRGGFLPAHVLQRLRAPCGIARAAWLAAAALRPGRFDVVVCDLVAHTIPLARFCGRAPIVFYCHYPDRLLAPRGGGALYRWYRAPIDRLEERATGTADRVLVNSRFTATRFHKAFPGLAALTPEVVYPGVAIPTDAPAPAAGSTLLCVSRFDPTKRLERAVEALAELRRTLAPEAFAPVRLVLAGGYDARLRESRETVEGLQALARRLDLAAHVEIVRSPPDAELRDRLSRALCVVYTPEDEHFGLVPLEAMAAGRPVVAVRNGGPAETIRDGETGFLCEPAPAAFAAALARLIGDPERARRMGTAGREHVARHFSRAAFGARFDAVVRAVARAERSGR